MSLWGPSKVLILGDVPRVVVRDESEQRSVVMYGSPTIDGRVVSSASKTGDFAKEPERAAQKLNGEFVVVVETSDQIIIANDRFAAHPVFFLTDGSSLVISFSYRAIWRWLSENNRLKVDALAFYEFLHFQRLFGATTFDEATSALTPATVLTFSKITGKLQLTRYWKPDFSKRHDGRAAIARDLADAVTESVALKTSNASSVSLLLSGGMDSRVVLGGFRESELPLCVTVGEFENNEVDVARALAATAGASHSFVQRVPTHYADILQKSTAVGGGMYLFQHGHFFDLDIPETDLILHGHGFDYFFQGMYLPSHRRRILGRPTRSWALDPIGFDLVGQYISEAKYRLKGIDSASLLKPELVSEANDRLRADLDAVLRPVNGETSEPYDEWDYLTTSAPGRHYTYLNLLSAGSLAEQRTVAFDNDIFDIYYSTPAGVRHGTMLLAETTKQLNPELLKVRNANTNLMPGLSPLKLTVDGWTRGAKRRIGLGSGTSADPSVSDRSWPTGPSIIRSSPALISKLEKLSKAEGIGSLDLFDEAKIERISTEMTEGNDHVASALLSLMTIDEFLSPG